MKTVGATFIILPKHLGGSIVCLKCGRESFHPKDVAEKYCGCCHSFHDPNAGLSQGVVTEIVEKFVQEVNRRAEDNMLKTGKLEGSHYAAMKQLVEELKGGMK